MTEAENVMPTTNLLWNSCLAYTVSGAIISAQLQEKRQFLYAGEEGKKNELYLGHTTIVLGHSPPLQVRDLK